MRVTTDKGAVYEIDAESGRFTREGVAMLPGNPGAGECEHSGEGLCRTDILTIGGRVIGQLDCGCHVVSSFIKEIV